MFLYFSFFFYRRVVDSVVESARFFALLSLSHNQVSDVDDVSQFADFS